MMDPNGMMPLLIRYLPAIFLAVTGLMVGILFSGPLIDHILPRLYGRKLSPSQSGAVRWTASLGMALLCFMLAGNFGLGGGGSAPVDQLGKSRTGESQTALEAGKDKVEVSPRLIAKKNKPFGLRMRVLGPDLAKEYSGLNFLPNNLFWFADFPRDGDSSIDGKEARQALLDWNSAQKRILEWKVGQPPGKLHSVQFLYTTQDPDDSSPLVVEVTRWCRENGITLERQTTTEGLP